MKNAIFQNKTSEQTTSSQQNQSVNNDGISLAPPEYGIDFVDRQGEDISTEFSSWPVIQAKLIIGRADDEYEREADRVAAGA